MRWLVLCLSLLALPAAAQDRAQTLADIKAELGQLMAEFNALKSELVSTGAAATGAAGGDALQRMDAIEAELTQLTAKAEEIELRLNKVVTDGTNRIGDLEFRLCEVTEGCDLASLPPTPTLGGDPGITVAPTPTDTTGGVELAMNEQADYDKAKAAFDAGDFRAAADLFAAFGQNYPGGPLTQEAHYHRGEALAQLGETANSARAYLEGFSGAPNGSFAAPSLLKLGEALGQLGQKSEACVTLGEVGTRFPGSIEATNAQVAMQGLGCS